MKLTLGNTVYATSIVVSVFMGGLALGAYLMSRYSDRIRHQLRIYALLETLITVSALSIPWLLKLADSGYVRFFRSFHPPQAGLLLLQVILSAAILLIPSMIMGSTLPLLARFVTALEEEVGHLVGRLYALNTLGAASGCFLAGFLLIRHFGVMGTLYIAAVLNLCVAIGGWLLSRTSYVQPGVPDREILEGKPELNQAKVQNKRFILLVFAFFMSGFISIGYELLWMRSAIFILGGATYVFSAVLTIYLLGNVIGTAIGSGIVKRIKVPIVGFAVTLTFLGLCGIVYLPWLKLWMSELQPSLKTALSSVFSLSPSSQILLGPFIQNLVLLLVPSIFMGIGFPLALQGWADHIHKVGRTTGVAYAVNTIGAVVGGILTGFVVIPRLGAQLGILILGLSAVWIAGALFVSFGSFKRVVTRYGLAVPAVLSTLLAILIPADSFHDVVRASPRIPPQFELLEVKEGITTTVSVHRDLSDLTLHMYSSGQSIAGDNYALRGDQKALGHFGSLLNRNAKKILSVGFGSGETTRCLSFYNFDTVDCVEIAPEVVNVGLRFFQHINLGDQTYDRVNLIFMDAKNFLRLTDKEYDLIINDSIHPREFAENASLYAKEYFMAAKQRMRSNGMFISWLPIYQMPISVFKSIIGTALEVYPHISLWYLTPSSAPLVLLACSERPQVYSIDHIDNFLSDVAILESLSGINIRNSKDFLSCYICDERELTGITKSFAMNSDFFPYVEFNTEPSFTKEEIFRRFVLKHRSESLYEHLDWSPFNDTEREEWLMDFRNHYQASTFLLQVYGADSTVERYQYSVQGLEVRSDLPGLLQSLKRAEKDLFSEALTMIRAGKPNNALALVQEILKTDSQSAVAWAIQSRILQSAGNLREALGAAQRAVYLKSDNPEARVNLAFILFANREFKMAVDECRIALQIDSTYIDALEMLAQLLILHPAESYYGPEEAVQLALKACALTNYGDALRLETLASVYAGLGKYQDALITAKKAQEKAILRRQTTILQRLEDKISSYENLIRKIQ